MKYKNGMKLKCIKDIDGFKTGDIGEIVTVFPKDEQNDAEELFLIGNNTQNKSKDTTMITLIGITAKEVDTYFKVYETDDKENAISVSVDDVDALIEDSEIQWTTFFDKTTVVCCKLPNGFVITESSSCVDPKNYNLKLGIQSCMHKIKSRLFEFEGYLLSEMNSEIFENQNC